MISFKREMKKKHSDICMYQTFHFIYSAAYVQKINLFPDGAKIT